MDADQIQQLTVQLQNGNEQQRRTASYQLSKSKDPAVVPTLINAYNDPDSSVRQNVIDGLRAISSTEALDFLNSHKVETSATAKDPKASEYGQTVKFAGIICGLASWVSIGWAGSNLSSDPAGQGMASLMCGCLYGPMVSIPLGLLWALTMRIFLEQRKIQPSGAIQGIAIAGSGLVGIIVPQLLILLMPLLSRVVTPNFQTIR